MGLSSCTDFPTEGRLRCPCPVHRPAPRILRTSACDFRPFARSPISVASAELVLDRLPPPPSTWNFRPLTRICRPSSHMARFDRQPRPMPIDLSLTHYIDTFCHHFSIDFRRLLDYTVRGVISMECSRRNREPQGRISPNPLAMRRCKTKDLKSFRMRRYEKHPGGAPAVQAERKQAGISPQGKREKSTYLAEFLA